MRVAAPMVALDVSQSWLRAADTSAWRRARQRALDAAGDSVLLVGHTVRVGVPPALPGDTAALIARAAERAQLAGRPLLFVTDGESSQDDSAVTAALPGGSRMSVERVVRAGDLAVIDLQAPPAAIAGDSLRIRVLIAAGDSVASAADLAVSIDGLAGTRMRLQPLRPFQHRWETLVLRLPSGPRRARLTAAVTAAGDAEPRNDSASRSIHRGERITAVAVSTSPDLDFREVARVLRGTLSVPTFLRARVATTRWVDGAGRAVPERQVRAELAGAHVALLHGDTSYFGPPRAATPGGLAMLPTPRDSSEWYLSAPLPSPLAVTLRSIPFDSLAPVAADPASGGIPLLAARAGGQRAQSVGSLEDSARRVVTVAVSGTSRWALQGGVHADAFTTLWGSIFAALAERPGRGTASTVVVVPPRELQPQAAVLRDGAVGGPGRRGPRQPARDLPWLYALPVIFLSAEWLLRRRIGLR